MFFVGVFCLCVCVFLWVFLLILLAILEDFLKDCFFLHRRLPGPQFGLFADTKRSAPILLGP